MKKAIKNIEECKSITIAISKEMQLPADNEANNCEDTDDNHKPDIANNVMKVIFLISLVILFMSGGCDHFNLGQYRLTRDGHCVDMGAGHNVAAEKCSGVHK